MYPEIHFTLVNLNIKLYGAMNLAGLLAFLTIGQFLTRSEPDQRWRWWWLFLGMFLCYSIGANALASVMRGGIEGLRTSLLFGTGGRFGYWGGPLLFVIWTGLSYLTWRISPYPFLDVFAVAWSAAHIFAKIGCLCCGCCFGRSTELPWGLMLDSLDDHVPRHPTQLYEITEHTLTATLLLSLFMLGKFRGRLILLLGCCHGIASPVIESFEERSRHPITGDPLSGSQMVCLWAFVFSATVLFLDIRRKTENPSAAAQGGKLNGSRPSRN